jgi:hypothetical protein
MALLITAVAEALQLQDVTPLIWAFTSYSSRQASGPRSVFLRLDDQLRPGILLQLRLHVLYKCTSLSPWDLDSEQF